MKKNDWQQILRALGLMTQIGIVIIVNIGLGFLLGYLVDSWLGCKILFKVIGILIGIASGFYSDYRLIKSIIVDDDKKD